ncbi:hypothetical protein PS723_02768 [Pseudomonas fluorescens]|uniref:Uncharacterized protein n=1 Tax=Pseudomonas fluorescens TaxID=294 RepID=A0A5E7CD04_PSEFL|nr:hypothetical protein PS723_02768 [Pseudomonas fluorescens]
MKNGDPKVAVLFCFAGHANHVHRGVEHIGWGFLLNT